MEELREPLARVVNWFYIFKLILEDVNLYLIGSIFVEILIIILKT